MARRLALILILTLLAAPLAAQRFTASIRGTVTDPNGDALPGATVNLEGTETGLNRTTFTNEAGIYTFGDLPVGAYEVTVTLDGFKSSVVSGLELNVADVREVNAALELGDVSDTITVEAEAIPVETMSGEVSGLMTGEQIRELPLNGRNFVQLTLLQPGVSSPEGFDTKNKGLLAGVDLSAAPPAARSTS
ncbi:MAG: carboxypeptidase-like regulatory domain-containing protein [Acidobacteriota bacterium]|nr:carboxypeptidase-like regulatory domain-containing protein [Acidobacteriota bacterium]